MKKNEKRKSSKNRLLLLVLLLILTLGIGTVGTYAWFTSNKVVDVTDLEVNVRAVNGLEISANAVDWGVRLTKEDLVKGYTGDSNQLPDILGAVSTSGTVSNNLMNLYTGAVETSCADGTTTCDDPTYRLTTTQQPEIKCYDSLGVDENDGTQKTCTGQYFMAFDIFLKVDSDAELFLTANANVLNTSTYDLGIKNATRVAFLVQGNIPYEQYRDGVPNEGADPTPGSTAAQTLKGATADDVYIWEPNLDQHTASGVAAAKKYYNIDTTTTSSQLAYEGLKANIPASSTDFVSLTETNSTKWPAYFESVSPAIATTASHTGATTTLTLKAGVTKVRVYFWVEGQDVDAENDATGSDMKLNLEFSIN